MRRVNTYVGQPIERVEDLRFLRGRGEYVGDVQREGQWHAAVLRSPVAHGRIRRLDAAAALAMPGVRGVITAADFDGPIPTIPFRRPNPTIAPYAQPVIARDTVRYVGEPVALVLADGPELAEDALQAITLEIDHLPPVTDALQSLKGDVLLFEGTDTNCASVFTAEKGDVDAAFAGAAHTVRERFRVQRLTAMPMEPRGLLAEWNAAENRLTVSGAAKLPFFNRRSMAAMMNLPETSVDYVECDVGGGFGARGEFYPEDFLVAFAARKFGRPIKWIEDRREHFAATGHSRETEAEFEMAFDAQGTILGLRGDVYVDIGAYVRPNGMTPVRNTAQFMPGQYRIPNVRIEARGIVSNKVPAGTYRGPGRFEGCFFCERLVDIAARRFGFDGIDVRRRNLLTSAEMPYRIPSVLPNDGFGETQYDSGDYASAFDRCLVEAKWSEKSALQGKLIDGRYHGLGIGCFIEGGASGPREHARIALERDGSIAVYAGSSAIGQGLETVLAQIAADALEVEIDRVRVYHGSTTYLAAGFGSYGSRATVMGGSAVIAAAEALLAQFRTVAARRLGVAEDQVKVEGGIALASDGRRLTLAEVADEDLAADGTFEKSKPTYTYGTAVAHVAVDPKTGKVDVLDYVTVDDVGRVVNPLTLHGQVLGAAVQGLGSVFTEQVSYDENGQLLVGSLADYLIPVATDYPHLRAISLELAPSPNNPLGAKGAGEGGIIPVGGVLSNAVAAALSAFGVEPRELPLTPPRVWELIQKAKAGRSGSPDARDSLDRRSRGVADKSR
ncbi:MAG TPA: xanthine dehydrogenase family protein molybdopterin-binding subunit [Xanthobacteraceae bacterium]|nr:xanthine dehydrogenase family protein molybdopterin-binding subunit [Xanthobacteraceae bacterium]